MPVSVGRLTKSCGGLHEDGKKHKALCAYVLGQLIVVQDDVKDGFRHIGIDGGQMGGKPLDVMSDHSGSPVSPVPYLNRPNSLIGVLYAVIQVGYAAPMN